MNQLPLRRWPRAGVTLAGAALLAAACAPPAAGPSPAAPVAERQTAISRDQGWRLLADARAAIGRRDYRTARTTLDTVVADAERWEWLDVAADAHFMLGEIADRERRFRDAADAYARAYDASRRGGDQRRGVRDLNALTNALLDAGAFDKAGEAADEAGRLAERAQEVRGQATAHNNLGEARRLAGRLDEARTAYERALALARRGNDSTAIASILLNLGALERRAGRLAQARAHFVEARDLARRLNDPRASEYAQRSLEQLDEARRGAGSSR